MLYNAVDTAVDTTENKPNEQIFMPNFTYQIVKSNRKSLGISLKFDGSVIVRVPHKTPQNVIDQFIHKTQSWITNKLEHIQLAINKNTTDNLHYYLGQQYPIKEVHLDSDLIKFNDNEFLIKTGYMNQAIDLLADWYKLHTEKLVSPIIKAYALEFGLTYNKLKITTAKNRWGSCNSRGTICFSYRLSMLPLSVIKYIVVHELAHLKHLNHSKNFWSYVQLMYPEYKDAHTWLRKHRYSLMSQ